MYLCRCHSLEEEPTEKKKKKKKSQALQQAIFTLTFTVLILSLGGIVVASLEWGCFGCTYIPMCLCGSLSFCGGGRDREREREVWSFFLLPIYQRVIQRL